MLKSTLAVLVLIGFGLASADATITIDLQADRLDTALNAPMPTTGLVLLVADTLNTGFGPVTSGLLSVGSSVDGNDDVIVGKFDLSLNATPGFLAEGPTLTLSGNWNANDRLGLLWFPNLSLASTTDPAGTSFGSYTTGDTDYANGSQPWITPADGSNIALYFFTTDGAVVVGSHSAVSGDANNLVLPGTAAPEPTTWATIMLGVVLVGGLGLRRRATLAQGSL